MILQLIVYLVCFDLAAEASEQLLQIKYWLDYLHSFLSENNVREKWRIMLVGLRSDLEKSNNNSPRPTSRFKSAIASWQQTWPELPIFSDVFVTSKETSSTIDRLWVSVYSECQQIMSEFTSQIPTSYLLLLQHLGERVKVKGRPFLTVEELRGSFPENQLMPALRYLHAVGDIVLLQDGLLCTDPSAVSKMMANFISPENVQHTLPHIASGKAVILNSDDIGKVLLLNENDPR